MAASDFTTIPQSTRLYRYQFVTNSTAPAEGFVEIHTVGGYHAPHAVRGLGLLTLDTSEDGTATATGKGTCICGTARATRSKSGNSYFATIRRPGDDALVEQLKTAAGQPRRFMSWPAALAAGLDELLVPLAAQQRGVERVAKREHDAKVAAEHAARYNLEVLQRAAEGEVERLDTAASRAALDVANAIRDLNLGRKDLGREFDRIDLGTFDVETLRMMRNEVDTLRQALENLIDWRRAQDKFATDLKRAKDAQLQRDMDRLSADINANRTEVK